MNEREFSCALGRCEEMDIVSLCFYIDTNDD